MAKSGHISARIDEADKKQAEAVFEKLGISASQAISMFYKQVRLRTGIPFPVELPNETTAQAIQDAREGKVRSYDSLDELKSKLSG
ncbi:MAG: type II toxin-antitoxin system RelB/DinJ family antitoxin [Rhodothermales bacterium]